MDIVELKAHYGDRLCLCGNVELDFPLSRGTPDDVRDAVLHLMRAVGPGGGYAIGSSNSISGWVPFENYQALRTASLDYGSYPIRIQGSGTAGTGWLGHRAVGSRHQRIGST